MMNLIPVLDIKAGEAVMAVGGKRELYRPLLTPLCPDSDVVRVVSSLLALAPFPILYIADLDAILGMPDNGIIIERIRQEFPHLHLWIDRGWPPIFPTPRVTPVICSESLDQAWRSKLAMLKGSWILSLDFNVQGYVGPKELLKAPNYWPPSVILMSLAKVGTRSGPDWQRLTAFARRYPNTCWIAAGGISSSQDLERLQTLGIRHALVATALHYGLIQAA